MLWLFTNSQDKNKIGIHMKRDSLLLCMFTKPHLISKKIDEIRSKVQLQYDKVFVLVNADNPNEIFLTFNAMFTTLDNYKDLFKNTINLHRKKKTNSLYTINALNKALELQYGSIHGTSTELN
jgi:hypothetical protein